MGGEPRLTPAEFRATDFRVNSFLADVPLHDVWVFQLRGGDAGLTLLDIQNVLAEASPLDANTAVEPSGDGYTMYWAIYVRETGGLTPIYMSLIDPFRRYVVYPSIVRSVERTWAARWNE